jgi:3-oxoadipate enol-lactonase
MPYATTPDDVKLYYEEVGQGTPILFVHEFAGDHRSWERQLREFGKRYRCIAYNARGYRPSDIPVDPKAYSYVHVMRDAVAMLDHLKIDKAHLIGLSMGGYTALQVALNHPQRVRSLVLAGAGSGSERWYTEDFHKRSRDLAAQFERKGSAAVAQTYGRTRAAFNWSSRILAALPNFRNSFPSTTRKDQRTCHVDSRANALHSMTSKAAFGGLRRRP